MQWLALVLDLTTVYVYAHICIGSVRNVLSLARSTHHVHRLVALGRWTPLELVHFWERLL